MGCGLNLENEHRHARPLIGFPETAIAGIARVTIPALLCTATCVASQSLTLTLSHRQLSGSGAHGQHTAMHRHARLSTRRFTS
jgi:hypothetical protein